MKKLILTITMASLTGSFIPAFAQADSNISDEQASGAPAVVADLPSPDLNCSVAIGAPAEGRPSFTDEQLEKLNTIKNQFADASGPKRLELQSAQRQLKDLMTQPGLDRKKATDLQAKINALRADLANMHLSMRMDSLDVFTADQKKQLREASLKRQFAGLRKGHGRGHGGCKRGDS